MSRGAVDYPEVCASGPSRRFWPAQRLPRRPSGVSLVPLDIRVVDALRPSDRVIAFAYLHVTDPSADHGAVARQLKRFGETHQDIDGRIQRDSMRVSGPNLPLSADTRAAIENLFVGPGMPPVEQLPDAAARVPENVARRKAVALSRRTAPFVRQRRRPMDRPALS